MIEPKRALVRPRVISPISGQTLLLEDEILSLIERGKRATVALAGGPGSGKTTALAHLAAALPASARVRLEDNNELAAFELTAPVVVSSRSTGDHPRHAIASISWPPGPMMS